MNTETVITLNPNQLIHVRRFQNFICKVMNKNGFTCLPFFPLIIECNNLSTDSAITSVSLSDFSFSPSEYEYTYLHLSFSISIQGQIHAGRMIIAQVVGNYDNQNQSDLKKYFDEAKSSENFGELLTSLKKISPFKLNKINIERAQNSLKWEILSEKWIKL